VRPTRAQGVPVILSFSAAAVTRALSHTKPACAGDAEFFFLLLSTVKYATIKTDRKTTGFGHRVWPYQVFLI
jgi:hypothetical protein